LLLLLISIKRISWQKEKSVPKEAKKENENCTICTTNETSTIVVLV
jgi:uncharacterized protein YpmS